MLAARPNHAFVNLVGDDDEIVASGMIGETTATDADTWIASRNAAIAKHAVRVNIAKLNADLTAVVVRTVARDAQCAATIVDHLTVEDSMRIDSVR